MSTHTPTGFSWREALEPLDARRQARVVASFAEYLAEDVHGRPDRALEAMASLAEWCDANPELLAQARADAVRLHLRAHGVAPTRLVATGDVTTTGDVELNLVPCEVKTP